MKGWLVDTNVIASLIASNGAPSVKKWALAVEEQDLYLSVLTLGEYDKGIANLSSADTNTARYIEARDALQLRFTGRILSLEEPIIRRWGAISGRVKRETGHAPPVIDTLLAATAIEKDLYLVSRNIRDLANSGAAIFDPGATNSLNSPSRLGRADSSAGFGGRPKMYGRNSATPASSRACARKSTPSASARR